MDLNTELLLTDFNAYNILIWAQYLVTKDYYIVLNHHQHYAIYIWILHTMYMQIKDPYGTYIVSISNTCTATVDFLCTLYIGYVSCILVNTQLARHNNTLGTLVPCQPNEQMTLKYFCSCLPPFIFHKYKILKHIFNSMK